jgi:hypothetical protein
VNILTPSGVSEVVVVKRNKKQLCIWLTPEDDALLRRVARKHDLPLSDVISLAVRAVAAASASAAVSR